MSKWKIYDHDRHNYPGWVKDDMDTLLELNLNEKLLVLSIIGFSIIGIGYYSYKLYNLHKKK